jgi:DNA-binding beta-propeller fold protein YncE
MSLRLLWTILLPLLSTPALGGTMNKCIHPDGQIEFTDAPCIAGSTSNPDKSKEPARHVQQPGDGIDGISTITLLAGSKEQEGANDGTGVSARFNNPGGIISDRTNVYVVDTSNQTIRKLELATGKVTTLAGRVGKRGHKDGAGNEARFNIPQGIAIDGDDLYVTDVASYCIRKISISTGNVTTFAGNPGNPGRTDGTGKEAKFSYPLGITAVGSNLYVTDESSNTVRKIEIATAKVTTFAGKDVLVELDPSVLSHLPVKVTGGQPLLSHVSGYVDGTGEDARFKMPSGITNDGKNLYVSDKFNNKIRKIDIATAKVTTLAGPDETVCATGWRGRCPGGIADGPASEARFSYPDYLATDGVYLYVGASNKTIRRISLATGEVMTLISGEAGATRGSEIARQLGGIWGLLVSDHSLIVADRIGNAIYKLQ